MNPSDPTPPAAEPPPEDRPQPAEPAAAVAAAPVAAAAVTATPAAGPGLELALDRLARELMVERKAERRWRNFFRLAWLGLALAVFWMVMHDGGDHSPPSGPHTALVEVRGELAPETEASAEKIIAGLRRAFQDQGAKAVVLRINSPGGSPVQAGIVNDEIRRLKALHTKKVYAVVEDVCASGAYYIAVAADEIYVDKASMVGSIGVIMEGFGFTGVLDKAGIERRLITAGANKALADPFSPEKPEQRAYLQSMLDQVHQQFIQVVREGRGKRLKESADTFSGLVWNGEEAVRIGLADHLGNLDYIAREVVKAEEVIDYTPHENVAERLARRFGAAMGKSVAHAISSLGRLH